MKIEITKEMLDQAQIESAKREQLITHHFKTNFANNNQTNQIGFLGEFAFSQLATGVWNANIRDGYETIDDFDLVYNNQRIDVKTETVPKSFLEQLINRTINDNGPYGRRLINHGQGNLLNKYDIVVFGVFERDNSNFWYPIGFLETRVILERYKPTIISPYGKRYTSPAYPIHTSSLRPINELLL